MTPAQTDTPAAGAADAPPTAAQQSKKVSVSEGQWSFDVISETSDGKTTSRATLTYYSGHDAAVVIVPAVLGGAAVTKIGPQTFGHHDEIAAVFVPDSVTEIADWAFYDLNKAGLLSVANAKATIGSGAIQSSGQLTVYLPQGAQAPTLAVPVKTAGTHAVQFTVHNPAAAAIAGGNYLAVDGVDNGTPSLATIAALGRSASGKESDVLTNGSEQSFQGEAYQPQTPVLTIAAALAGVVDTAQFHSTLRALTAAQASALNQQLSADAGFKTVAPRLTFAAGYYLDGSAVAVDDQAEAWDASSGQALERDADSGLLPSTAGGQYKYVAWFDDNQDGRIDRLYYSPVPLSYQYDEVKLSSSNALLDGLAARTRLNPTYLAFANAVRQADGADQSQHFTSLSLDTAQSGDAVMRRANRNRSVLWANDYASLSVDHLDARSSSVGDWARISLESGLASVNSELIMEWGMNAVLYATNGGQISVGKLGGRTSLLQASGDGANGVLAGGAGDQAGRGDAPAATASIRLVNARAVLEGWNNHLADAVYGGHASLEHVQAVTGKPGSYAVGQSSALANDFGDGVVEAKHLQVTVYGNRSAGAYVIGGGRIAIADSALTSHMDAGLVIASGGHLAVERSRITGQIGIRNRGGIVADSSSSFDRVTLHVLRDLSGYHVGPAARQAMQAWQQASGALSLQGFLQSDASMTLGGLADFYQLGQAQRTQLFATLTRLAGATQDAHTPLRNSLLDNTFYDYSANAFSGQTDFSDVPYLTVGSSFGGFVAAALQAEDAGTQMNFQRLQVEYGQPQDFRYLLSSEAGSAMVVNIADSQVAGIVWNEGKVKRAVEGRPGERSSSFQIKFENSTFTGSFADGDDGLWPVAGLSYQDAGKRTRSLNGNYYGATGNRQGKASFDARSTWQVTHDSWLGELTLAAAGQIRAPAGKTVVMTVDGKPTEPAAGHYQGEIVVRIR
ncbi:MAG: hypothetical protein QM601_02230 [Pseudoxanthomonas sp.]